MYYQELLDDFVVMCREILGEGIAGEDIVGKEAAGVRTVGSKSPLTGVYLHGSMAMGCFNPQKSDIDLIVVVEGEVSDGQKMRFMEQVVQMNERAPAKGLELSIVQRKYCRPFVYPTPFELHFSQTHLQWFRERPEDYIRNMKGEDRDLAAHFTIINRYGIALYGEAVHEVFGEVPKSDYADSIWSDVENAEEDIEGNAVYVILNLCRVAAFLREGLCLSKAEGGEWGLRKLSGKYRGLIQGALDAYRGAGTGCGGEERAGGFEGCGGEERAGGIEGCSEAGRNGGPGGVRGQLQAGRELARQFAADMLGEIKDHLVQSSMDVLQ